MPVKIYEQYVVDLLALVREAIMTPEKFRTVTLFLNFPLAAPNAMICVVEKTNKGVIKEFDMANIITEQKVKDLTEADLLNRLSTFSANKVFVAVSGRQPTDGKTTVSSIINAPGNGGECHINLEYRKIGQPKKRSTRMHFIGYPDRTDAFLKLISLAQNDVLLQDFETPVDKTGYHEWV